MTSEYRPDQKIIPGDKTKNHREKVYHGIERQAAAATAVAQFVTPPDAKLTGVYGFCLIMFQQLCHIPLDAAPEFCTLFLVE